MNCRPKRQCPADFAAVCAKLQYIKPIMAHYGAGQKAMYRWLSETGICLSDKRKSPCLRAMPADFAKLAPDMSREELKAHYRTGTDALRRWIAESGIEPRSYVNKRIARPANFALVAPTMTTEQLGKHFHCSKGVIHRWLSETGTKAFRLVQPSQPRPRPFHVSARSDGGLGTNFTATRTWTVHDLAADELRRNGWPVYHCDERGRANEKGEFWRAGNVVLTPDELLTRAERYRAKAA